jgi:hypothetical protein
MCHRINIYIVVLNFRQRELRATLCSYSFKYTDHPCDVCDENGCSQRDPNDNPNGQNNPNNPNDPNGNQGSQDTDSNGGQTGAQDGASSESGGKTVKILHWLDISLNLHLAEHSKFNNIKNIFNKMFKF